MNRLITMCNVDLLQWTIAAVIVLIFVSISVGTIFLMMYTYRKFRAMCEKKRGKGEDCINIITLIMCSLIVVALIIFMVIIIIHANTPLLFSDFTLKRFGLLGDYFGGFIGTFVAAIVAIYAIRTYKSERELQKEASVSAMLSTMLELHKQNVNEIEITYYQTSTRKYKGREAFIVLYKELNEIYEVVIGAINNIILTAPQQYEQWSSDKNKKKLAHALSYGYFFYGVESYIITREAGTPLFQICEEVRAIASELLPEKMRELHRHSILGHYFRHLFNMVNYIDTNNFTDNYEKKAFFVKLIRSQLSDYEQILLYYNSLSTLGANWNKPLRRNKIDEMNLICKYKILKNCPYYVDYLGIHPMEMYVAEEKVWQNENGELLFETDPQGQLQALDEILK